MSNVWAPPSHYEMDGIACAEIAGFTTGDMWKYVEAQILNESYAEFYRLLINDTTNQPDPDDPDAPKICNPRIMVVEEDNRGMVLEADNRTMVVPCGSC